MGATTYHHLSPAFFSMQNPSKGLLNGSTNSNAKANRKKLLKSPNRYKRLRFRRSINSKAQARSKYMSIVKSNRKDYRVRGEEWPAILTTCKRFKNYVCEISKIAVRTNHKTLESIFLKHLNSSSKGLPRTRLQLTKYDLTAELLRKCPLETSEAPKSLCRLRLEGT